MVSHSISAIDGGTVHRSVDVEQARLRVGAVVARAPAAKSASVLPSEIVKHVERAGGGDLEGRSIAVPAPVIGSAVERTAHVGQARPRILAVDPACKTVEDALSTGRRDRENRAIAVCTAAIRRAIKRAIYVSQRCLWVGAVRAAREGVENSLRPARSLLYVVRSVPPQQRLPDRRWYRWREAVAAAARG